MGYAAKIKKLALPVVAILVFFSLFCFAQRPNSPGMVIYGDSRSNHAIHRKIARAIIQARPSVVFNVGDLVENGLNPHHWATFNKIVSQLTKIAPYYPCLGNHERESPLYFVNFKLLNNARWYAREIEGIHFIVLDSNLDMSIGSPQYQWLEADLKHISEKIKFIVVLLHHPPFNTSRYPEDEKGLKVTIVPLLEKYGADIVFSGHGHHYERLQYHNIYYIVTGGGGAPLHPQVRKSPYSQVFVMKHHFCKLSVVNNQLIVEVRDSDLNLIDQFQLNPKGRR